MGIKVKIIEKNPEKCEVLTEMLPKAMVICGDATDKELLMEEGLMETEAFIASTDFDKKILCLPFMLRALLMQSLSQRYIEFLR